MTAICTAPAHLDREAGLADAARAEGRHQWNAGIIEQVPDLGYLLLPADQKRR
jgi:hypothetical protein